MFCYNCGKEIDDSSRFCVHCGTKLTKDVSDESVTAPDESIIAAKDDVVSTEAAVSDAEHKTIKENVVKNKKGIKTIAFAALAVIIVAASITVAFAFPYISNFVVKGVSSPEAYYKHVESSVAKDVAADVANIIASLKGTTDEKLGVSNTTEIILGDKLKSLLSESGNIDLSWLNSVGVSIDGNSYDNLAEYNSIFLINGNKAINFDAIIDGEQQNVYLKIPELSEKYLSGNFSDIFADADTKNSFNISTFTEIIPNEDVIEELILRYHNLIIDCVDDVDEKSDIIDIDDIKQNATLLTFKIDEDTLKDIVLVVLKEAKDDEDIKQIIFDTAEQLNENADEVYNEFIDNVKDLIDELKEAEDYSDNDNKQYINVKIWVDLKGEIIGRGVSSKNFVFEYKTATDGDDFACKVKLNVDENELLLAGKGERNNKIIKGDFDLEYNDAKLISLKIYNYDFSSAKEGYLNGKIKIALSNEIVAIMDLATENSSSKDKASKYELELEFKSNEKKSDTKLSALFEGEEFFTIKVKSEQKKYEDIIIPDNAYNLKEEAQMNEWFKDINIESFIGNLKTVGLPVSVTELLEGVLSEKKDSNEYLPSLDTYFDIVYNGNITDIKTTIPDDCWASVEEKFNMSYDQIYSVLESSCAQYLSNLKLYFGENAKVEYKIYSTDLVDSWEFSNIQSTLKDDYNIIESRIKKAYSIGLDIYCSGDKDSDQDSIQLYAVKIDDLWYICDDSYQLIV